MVEVDGDRHFGKISNLGNIRANTEICGVAKKIGIGGTGLSLRRRDI